MRSTNSRRGRPEVAAAVIDELGVKVIREESRASPSEPPVSPSTVTFYKQNGFPVFFEKYLRTKYRKLKAWEVTE